MSLKIFLFEDPKFSNFYPLTYNRPVYELLLGITKLREKVARYFPEAEIRLLCRDYLQSLVQLKTGLKVNQLDLAENDQILLLNGRVVADSSLPNKFDLNQEKTYWQEKALIAVTLSAKSFSKTSPAINSLYEQTELFKQNFKKVEVEVELLNYLWDLVECNGDEITRDFKSIKPKLDFKDMFERSLVDQQCVIYNLDNVYIGKNVKIEAFAVLNAEKGPIFIDEDCTIQAFSRIEGPAYLGKKTEAFGAQVGAGCSFGPACRLGGQIQKSIFLGYSNKYHQGFIGHSYLGEWVNLGAGTTNSDLKNNYSRVKVNFPNKSVETGLTKVGTFIADHVKTGIGTLLNTGTYLGLGSNIFGGGMIDSKLIPSFAWGDTEELKEYSWDKFLTTAEAVMQRRGVVLEKPEREVLKKLFELTKPERKVLRPS